MDRPDAIGKPAEEGLEGLGLVAGDDDEPARAALGRPANDMLDQRPAGDPGERLGAAMAAQPGPLAGGDDQAFHRRLLEAAAAAGEGRKS